MMRALVLSDIHGEESQLRWMLEETWKPAKKKSSPKWDLLQGNLAEGGEKEVQHK